MNEQEKRKTSFRFKRHEPLSDLTKDLLGFEELVPRFVDILRVTDPPYVIGITGEWGIGKSSFLELVKNQLQQDKDVKVTDRIELWKFSGRVDLSLIVLEAIAQHFDISDKEGKKGRFLERLNQAKRTLFALISAFKLTYKQPDGNELKAQIDATEADEKITKIWNVAKKEGEESFSKKFDDLVEEGLSKKSTDAKLVVILDDLDRCLPNDAFDLLQTLRIFFDSKRVIFLIALDESVIKAAIQSRFGQDSGVNGQWYLEKLLDRRFRIPFPSPEKLNTFLEQKCEEFVGEVPKALKGPMINWGFDKMEIYGSKAANNPRRIIRAVEQMIETASLTDYSNHSVIYAAWPFFVIREIYPEFYEYAKMDGTIATDWGRDRGIRERVLKDYGEPLSGYLDDQNLIGLCTVVKQVFASRDKSKELIERILRFIDGEVESPRLP